MRGITLLRPWAWAIFHAGKRVENRTWGPPAAIVGQRIALHAGLAYDHEAAEWMRAVLDLTPPATMDDPAGCIVGVATVRGWVDGTDALLGHSRSVEHRHAVSAWSSAWFAGPCGWMLDDLRALAEPVPCRGRQGLWALPPDVERSVLERLP